MATAKMYRVYSVISRPKQDDFWLNIGTAFPHEKGDGFNIVLQALPLRGNGRLVMRAIRTDRRTPSRPKRTTGAKPTTEQRRGPLGAAPCNRQDPQRCSFQRMRAPHTTGCQHGTNKEGLLCPLPACASHTPANGRQR